MGGGAEMNLTMRASKGHYDILHPENESINVYMRFEDKAINLSFSVDDSCPDYLDDPRTWTDTAIQLIDRWNKKTWISTRRTDVLAFKELIGKHQKEIDLAKLKEVIEEKRKSMIRLGEDICDLEKEICDLLVKEAEAIHG